MKLYNFAANNGHVLIAHGSHGVRLTPVIWSSPALNIACFHLEPGGVIARHKATTSQLLLIVSGEAVVTGDDGVPANVAAGDAVLWAAGEWHETHSPTGATAFVMEGDNLDAPPGFRLQPRTKTA